MLPPPISSKALPLLPRSFLVIDKGLDKIDEGSFLEVFALKCYGIDKVVRKEC